MRTIKKLKLNFGQLLDEQQQSMILAGEMKTSCGCKTKGDLCVSSTACNLPLYQWVCAAAANLVMKVGPSGIIAKEARDRLQSGWSAYVSGCENAKGSIEDSLMKSCNSHLVRECTYIETYSGTDGLHRVHHNDLGTVFSE